jgi:hypothetical protein
MVLKEPAENRHFSSWYRWPRRLARKPIDSRDCAWFRLSSRGKPLRTALLSRRAIEAHAARLLEEAVPFPAAAQSKAPAKDMVELFAPLRGLNIDFERDRDPSRDIVL